MPVDYVRVYPFWALPVVILLFGCRHVHLLLPGALRTTFRNYVYLQRERLPLPLLVVYAAFPMVPLPLILPAAWLMTDVGGCTRTLVPGGVNYQFLMRLFAYARYPTTVPFVPVCALPFVCCACHRAILYAQRARSRAAAVRIQRYI